MRYFFILIFLLSMTFVSGQNNGAIQGILVDSDGNSLETATVSIVSVADSIVLSYTLSDTRGHFDIVRLPTNTKLVLYISHVSHASYEKPFTLQPSERLDLGKVTLGALSLEEIVITRVPPIRLHGDTLEYRADYFKTRPNASVEELLQLLPGLQVNADGTIFYQGKQVSGVRVNNKDFFIEDLTIATKNLDASLIEVVQVIKDRGESNLDVLDDENLPIVINLKTKREFLKANFGKFYGSGGTRERYESGVLVNTFRDTLQISFIGYANNLGREGFDYSELREHGGYDRSEGGDSGYIMYGGLQNKVSAGVNVNYDIQKKLKTNLMYNYERQTDYLRESNSTDHFYEDLTEYSQGRERADYHANKHYLRGFVRYTPDTTFRVSLDARGTFNRNARDIRGDTHRYRTADVDVHSGDYENNYSRRSPIYRQVINLEKSLSPKLIISLDQTWTRSTFRTADSRLAFDRYFIYNDSTVNQHNRESSLGGNTVLENRIALQWKHHKNITTEYYGRYNWNSEKLQNDIWRDLNEEGWVNRNDIANDRKRVAHDLYAGVKFMPTLFSKVKVEAGVEHLNLRREYHFYGKAADGNYRDRYFLPFATVSYDRMSFSFRRRVEMPYLFYLRSVDSEDFYPMRTDFASTYFDNTTTQNYEFRIFRILKRSKINTSFSIRYSVSDNSIASAQTYDVETTKRTRRYYSAPGKKSLYSHLNLNKMLIQKKDWRLNWSTNVSYNHYENYINMNGEEALGKSDYVNSYHTFSLTYNNNITLTPNYRIMFIQDRSARSNSFFRDTRQVQHYYGATLLLNDVKRFRLETSYSVVNQNVGLAQDRKKLHLVNASLYYPVLGKGEIKLSAFDVLNQNLNMWMYGNGYSNTFSQVETLRQYFMLGFVYKFLATGK